MNFQKDFCGLKKSKRRLQQMSNKEIIEKINLRLNLRHAPLLK